MSDQGFVLDFTAKTISPVSEGTHTATIKSAVMGTSKNSGNPIIMLQWQVTESADEQNVGRIVWDYLTFTQKAFYRVIQLVEACEIDVTQWHGQAMNAEIIQDIATTLLGETIVIETSIRPGTGINPRTDEPYGDSAVVDRYLPYGANRVNPGMYSTQQPDHLGWDKKPATDDDIPFGERAIDDLEVTAQKERSSRRR